jgi:TPR repeat protein
MMRRQILTSVCIAAMAMSAMAQSHSSDVLPQARTMIFFELERAEAMARYGHPNEMWRYRALRALKLDQPSRALASFRNAARYGDKYSQHALSLMYWHGLGTAPDRVQAYVWSDLAAERGYRDLLLVREKMWMQLDAAQRALARSLGEENYARFGDEVAKPRLEWEMRKALASATGSRLGFAKDRIAFVRLDGVDISGRDFYAPERWRAQDYWRTQDAPWNGRVIVLPLEQLPDAGQRP